nr:hypothetical protein [Tanacetum cinerariifolium]
ATGPGAGPANRAANHRHRAQRAPSHSGNSDVARRHARPHQRPARLIPDAAGLGKSQPRIWHAAHRNKARPAAPMATGA